MISSPFLEWAETTETWDFCIFFVTCIVASPLSSQEIVAERLQSIVHAPNLPKLFVNPIALPMFFLVLHHLPCQVYDRRPANGAGFVCFGQQCVASDSEVARQLIQYTCGCLDALKITDGATHTEAAARGGPRGPPMGMGFGDVWRCLEMFGDVWRCLEGGWENMI